MSDQIPALGDVLAFPDELQADDYHWLVLFEDDYDNVAIDPEGNVAVKVDIDQTVEVIRLAGEILASLSAQDADGDDVLRDMVDALNQEVDDE